MHSTLSIASLLLAASTAFALPAANVSTSSTGADTEVRVILSSQSTETGSQTAFANVDSRKHKRPVGSSGPFETIEISVGADAQQDLRCQALDLQGNPLIATRGMSSLTISLPQHDTQTLTPPPGENVDITFSDADKGAWTFRDPEAQVSRIICDPAFEAVSADAFEVRVQLSTSDLATQTVFPSVEDREELAPTGTTGPFDTVEIIVGELVDPALRCGLLNGRGKPIVATRGENVDTTFSDADKGPWAFRREQKVSKIICDPAFVARPQ